MVPLLIDIAGHHLCQSWSFGMLREWKSCQVCCKSLTRLYQAFIDLLGLPSKSLAAFVTVKFDGIWQLPTFGGGYYESQTNFKNAWKLKGATVNLLVTEIGLSTSTCICMKSRGIKIYSQNSLGMLTLATSPILDLLVFTTGKIPYWNSELSQLNKSSAHPGAPARFSLFIICEFVDKLKHWMCTFHKMNMIPLKST